MTVSSGGYDSSGIAIAVDPNALVQLATVTIPSVATGLVDSLTHINDTLSALKVSWVGQSSEQAQAFDDRWTAAMGHLFGTKDNPKLGVLNRFMDGVGLAAFNYGYAEDGVAKMWSDLAGALEGGGSDQPASPKQPGANEPIVENP